MRYFFGFLMYVEEKVLLRPEDVKPSLRGWSVRGVLNPAAIRWSDKKIVLFARVAEMPKEHIGTDLKARSSLYFCVD